jgi:hypothetical protein
MKPFILINIESLNNNFFFFFVCSSCSHLEHRVSVKRFISLQCLNLRQSVGLLGKGIRRSQGRYLTQTQNKHKETSLFWVEFEPTIPVFERMKTVRALDRTVTVIGWIITNQYKPSRIYVSANYCSKRTYRKVQFSPEIISGSIILLIFGNVKCYLKHILLNSSSFQF